MSGPLTSAMLSVSVYPGQPREVQGVVASAALDASGALVLTLTDGSTVAPIVLTATTAAAVVQQINGISGVAAASGGVVPTSSGVTPIVVEDAG
ncbi:MAG: hypothetical protein ABF968_07430 [Acetobacter sp.]